jgi:hypothetical protein
MKNQLNGSLADLKEFMYKAKPKTVDEWNEARDRAKSEFTSGAISALDGSGLISKIIKPLTRPEYGSETE